MRAKALLFLLVLSKVATTLSAPNFFRVGQGIFDITGPAADAGMMGYGKLSQRTQGIATRLWSRSFFIEDPVSNNRVAIVTADLCFITSALREAVLKSFNEQSTRPLTHDQLLIQATHTHSGPGGFSHHILVNITSLGFIKDNFHVIVAGITQSLLDAQNRLQPAHIYLSHGALKGASVNRSFDAYVKNPDAIADEPTNERVTQLNFFTQNGKPLGLLNWFSVHATSLGNTNHLISSDNKGLAAYLFERMQGSSPISKDPFVAAFANSDEGDSSPHTEGLDRISDSNLVPSATLQLNKANELFTASSLIELSPGTLKTAHQFVHMPSYNVEKAFSYNGDAAHLCSPVLGVSFVAGAEDGRGISKIPEGIRVGDHFPHEGIFRFFRFLLSTITGAKFFIDDPCQFPKPSLVSTGLEYSRPIPWSPETLPFQLIQLGGFAIATVPGEMTTTAGRRLRAQIEATLGDYSNHGVVLAGLANEYTHYITTPEEYQVQDYEGASTLYGPNTLPAYLQIYANLAELTKSQSQLDLGKPALDLTRYLPTVKIGVLFDERKASEKWGEVLVNPYSAYAPGQSVHVEFRSAHPAANLMTGRGYLEVQKLENSGQWATRYYDWDPETKYTWKRDSSLFCLACSRAAVEWEIPSDVEPGTYRILHHAERKVLWTRKTKAFENLTDSFRVGE